MKKTDIVSKLNLNKKQVEKIEFFLNSIVDYNKHTNLIGKSTIETIWERHVLDCLQLIKCIPHKNMKIIDLGTGAGLPGILLSIVGYKNVQMVDSVKKKTDFVRKIIKELSLSAKIHNKRIEKPPVSEHDIVISRALAPLTKLLTYARMYSNKNTTSLFLKGRSVNSEISMAMNDFIFDYKKIESSSSSDSFILEVKNIKIKNV